MLKKARLAAAGVTACADGTSSGDRDTDSGQQGTMTYRTNPSSGDKVSLLGYGCMRWPSVGGRSAREGNEEIVQEMVNALVDYAIAHGVNYFDTSPAYCQGKSEHATGIALSRHPREKYFIATKMSNFAPSTWSHEASAGIYRNSLKELQVDYLDYMLLHGIGMGNGMEEFKARFLDNGILDFLLEERGAGRSAASWAFRFAGSFPGVLTVLSGMTRMEHLQDNLKTYSPLDPLTEEEFSFLQEIAARMMQFDTIPCNDCKYCMPCPYGIDIPAILLHYNKCLNEGNTPSSPAQDSYRKARRAYLVSYDRSVPKLRQADHCIGCGQCSPHCPQRINIPGEMQRISRYAEKLRTSE